MDLSYHSGACSCVIGLLYYMSTPQESGGEGFLIRGEEVSGYVL